MGGLMAEGVPHRDVHTRRIRFAYPESGLHKHYVDGDLVMSHVVAVLSATFPPGEDFFVRSVRNFSDKITDPELKRQVAGFIGQEVTHGREHRELNRRAARDGLPRPTGVARLVKVVRCWTPRSGCRRSCASRTRRPLSTTPPLSPRRCSQAGGPGASR